MAEALAEITQITGLGMIQIRADLGQAGQAISSATGLQLPEPGTATSRGADRLCWMSPDELLLVLPAARTAGVIVALNAALETEHALVVDVSDMRVAFAVEGTRAAQVLMKLSPADIAAMPANGMRRSRAAQVPCGIWRETGGFAVIGFRSTADYLRGVLTGAARPGTALDPR